MTSSGREPKIYLRGVTPHTHTWWPRPPPSSLWRVGVIWILSGFICHLCVLMGNHSCLAFICYSCKLEWSCTIYSLSFLNPSLSPSITISILHTSHVWLKLEAREASVRYCRFSHLVGQFASYTWHDTQCIVSYMGMFKYLTKIGQISSFLNFSRKLDYPA